MLAQCRRRWSIIISALGRSIVLSGKWYARSKASPAYHPNAFSMLGQCRRLWVNIETALGECHVFADVLDQVYNRPSTGLVLGQHRGQLTSIEPEMGCDAGLTLNRNWVGRPSLCVRVHRRDAYADLSVSVSQYF